MKLHSYVYYSFVYKKIWILWVYLGISFTSLQVGMLQVETNNKSKGSKWMTPVLRDWQAQRQALEFNWSCDTNQMLESSL